MLERWRAETPSFFKRVITYALRVGGVGLSLTAVSSYLPIRLQPIPGYMIAVGAVAACISKLTVKDKDPEVDSKATAFLNQKQE